ncbi:MAG: zinc ABC transporter substrate-binding protein [Phycisphaeraceae bacterium]
MGHFDLRNRVVMGLAGVLLAGVAALGLAGCGERPADGASDGRPEIVVTTGMIADMVRHTVGEHANVTALMGEGVDPHLYRPTRRDVRRLQDADIIVYNGLFLEGRMGDVLEQQRQAGRHVVAVGDWLDEAMLLDDEANAEHADPHVWMDVDLWSRLVDRFGDWMGEVDPDHTDDYRANADRYIAELTELHDYVQQVIDSIPAEHRVLVTAHDAFNYFGLAYDIEVRGVYGISTDSQAGTHDINRLVDLIVERQLPAVFAESTIDDRRVRGLIEGAASRDHTLRLGGELFSDAMGAADTYEGTYIGMIDHNATTIARALGGDAPERGLHGRLGE